MTMLLACLLWSEVKVDGPAIPAKDFKQPTIELTTLHNASSGKARNLYLTVDQPSGNPSLASRPFGTESFWKIHTIDGKSALISLSPAPHLGKSLYYSVDFDRVDLVDPPHRYVWKVEHLTDGTRAFQFLPARNKEPQYLDINAATLRFRLSPRLKRLPDDEDWKRTAKFSFPDKHGYQWWRTQILQD